jgi:hypothetical protein
MEAVLQTIDLVKGERMRDEGNPDCVSKGFLLIMIHCCLLSLDIQQRHYENLYRRIMDARRLIDQKLAQLRTIGELSALICGFSIIVLTQSSLPADLALLDSNLLLCFGGITVLVVTILLHSLTSSFCDVLDFSCNAAADFHLPGARRCTEL